MEKLSAPVLNLKNLTPAQLAARCCRLPGFVFFDSAMSETAKTENANARSKKRSLLAAEPVEVIYGNGEADWQRLSALIRERSAAAFANGEPGNLRHGMAAGFVEYDDTFCFGIYEDALVYDHDKREWENRIGGDALFARWNALAFSESEKSALQNQSGSPNSLLAKAASSQKNFVNDSVLFAPDLERKDFLKMVRRAQEYIAAGDIYQVNLSQRFSRAFANGEHCECGDDFANSDPWRFYEALRECSPASFAAYLALGEKRILSSSPELFLKISGRRIVTRPIKGTRPRHANPDADAALERELISSSKEIAELTMITDLERNDLGQVCEYGSVAVSEMLKLRRYRQVFHLVSTVQGILREDVDHVSALRACFPGGSITGAPKKRAMEIIAELEPRPRGLYTGAIGYFGFGGESQFSIAIRTAVIENGLAHFHVGAGIVADSVPEMEYEETLHKAAGILKAEKQFAKKDRR